MFNFKSIACALVFCTAVVPTLSLAAANEPIPSAIVPLAYSAQINDVAASQGIVIGVGERGIILRRAGDGEWQQIQSPVSSLLNAVHLIGDRGWVVGHDAVVLKTEDAGLSWGIVHRKPELNKPFLDVFFLNEDDGFAVGAFGLFVRSLDGGKSWNPVEVDAFQDLPPHLNAISQLKDGALLIVGEMGTFAHSRDGVGWQVGNVDYEGSLFTIVPAGKHGAVIAGMRGNAFVSSKPVDATWEPVELATTKSVFGGDQGESGEVYLVAGAELLKLSPQKEGVVVGRVPVHLEDQSNGSAAMTAVLVQAGEIIAATHSGVHSVKSGR